MVTFLFTDVEGSTDHWASNADAMAASLRVHDDVLRTQIESHGGYVFTTAGDSFAAAFGRASDGLDAATAIQHALAETEWPGPTLRVRIGLHIGEAEERAGDYFGPPVNLAARVEAAAHGGQIIISDALHQIVGVGTRLGAFTLRGIPEPVILHQVDNGEHPPPRVPRPELSSLPIPPTALIGREGDVSTIRQQMRSTRLVTLVGPGGSGKTRLALEVAEQELPTRPEGVYFADLSGVTDERNVAGAIAIALKMVLSDGDVTGQVARYLSDKNSLLVIDNCEHVVDACADLIEQLLVAGGQTCLVATSREPLDLHGEQVVRVDPLPAEGIDSPGVTLFRDRAMALDASFALTDANLEAVAELVQQLDGIPLAIELAASRISSLSPHEMLERMDDRFRLLSGGRRSRRRSRTLESTMAWSYELLDDEERRCLRHCAAFVGGFDRHAIAQLLGVSDLDATDLLESLVAKSLVQTVDFGELTRFRLLETVRAYGLLQLREAGELTQVQTELLGVMLERHGFVEPPLWDGKPDLADVQLESDWRNISAALDIAFERERADDAARLFIGTWRLWWGVAPADEGFRWIDRFDSVELHQDLADRVTNVEGQLWLRIDRYSEFRSTGERLI